LLLKNIGTIHTCTWWYMALWNSSQ